MLRSWEPCLQALQDIVGDAERGASFREPPAGNGGKRPVVQQFETFADLFGLLRIVGLAVGLITMKARRYSSECGANLLRLHGYLAWLKDSVSKAPQ
ncbi:hypothetical protein CK221_25160 [Mesorhizobium sp. WSM3868]|nr:hypothetical protein CK221_25160 [Mesorhizobium sp. WSM3868]